MKLHAVISLAKVLPVFKRLFPVSLLKQMQMDCLPLGNFQRAAQPAELVKALVMAILFRLSSQQEIIPRWRQTASFRQMGFLTPSLFENRRGAQG